MRTKKFPYCRGFTIIHVVNDRTLGSGQLKNFIRSTVAGNRVEEIIRNVCTKVHQLVHTANKINISYVSALHI